MAKLKELCPNGIACYFDNVGGKITGAVFPLLNTNARISLCGQIPQYNLAKPEPGPPLVHLLVKQAMVQGFLVFQFADRYHEGVAQMARWIREGKLKYREEILEGFENTPKAFIGLFKGENTGKMLIKGSGTLIVIAADSNTPGPTTFLTADWARRCATSLPGLDSMTCPQASA